MLRRSFIQRSVLSLGSATFLAEAQASAPYPSKAIRVIVPTSAGGATDAVARLFAEQVGKQLQRPVVIENVPGAATLLAVRQVVKAAPDGYTLSVMANSFTTMPHVHDNPGYRTSDLKGVSFLARSSMFLVVSASSPYRSLNDLVQAARKTPSQLTYATVGEGTTSHIPVEMFAQAAGIQLTQVPYKAIPAAIPDVVGERVNLMMGTQASVGELLKNGKLRALAIAADARAPALPAVPTFAELGFKGVEYELYLGLLAPALIPADILERLSTAFEAAKSDPTTIQRLAQLDQALPEQNSAALFTEFLRKDEMRMMHLLQKKKA